MALQSIHPAGGKPLQILYPPTVHADARPGLPAWDEETFGPAAASS
jgi:hypothetical protein